MTKPSLIDFRIHAVRTGSDEAGRVDFHRMISALVGVIYPTAIDIRPDPGDWGLDVVAGSLEDRVQVWQVKYFYDRVGKSQRDQVRESLVSAMTAAKAEGYVVEAWTLCVATELSAPEKKWWDGRVREWSKEFPGVIFDLWEASRLRRSLRAPEAAQVLGDFYGAEPASSSPPSIEISLLEVPTYDTALFVKQLNAAGITELESQRRAFFNADLVARDIESRGVRAEVAAVQEIDAMLQGHWEDALLSPETAPNAEQYEDSARRLYTAVIARAESLSPPPELNIRPLHSRGFMHRIVDSARAGWVYNWRVIAEAHDTVEPTKEDSAEAVETEVPVG